MTKDSDPSPPAQAADAQQQPDAKSAASLSNPSDGTPNLSEPSLGDRARQLILKRRRFFVASALMGLSATGCESKEPQVCLSVVSTPEPGPQPSALSSADKPDASAQAQPKPAPSSSASASSSASGDSSAEPPKPEPTGPSPRVCLKIYIPPDAGADDQG